MTKHATEVRKAYGHDCRPDGWDLFIDGEWGNRFTLKRDAVAAAKEVTGSPRTTQTA